MMFLWAADQLPEAIFSFVFLLVLLVLPKSPQAPKQGVCFTHEVPGPNIYVTNIKMVPKLAKGAKVLL